MRGWREGPACVTIRWDVQRVAHAEAVVFQALGFGKMESYPAWFVAFNARCERLDVAPGGLVQKELSRTAAQSSVFGSGRAGRIRLEAPSRLHTAALYAPE